MSTKRQKKRKIRKLKKQLSGAQRKLSKLEVERRAVEDEISVLSNTHIRTHTLSARYTPPDGKPTDIKVKLPVIVVGPDEPLEAIPADTTVVPVAALKKYARLPEDLGLVDYIADAGIPKVWALTAEGLQEPFDPENLRHTIDHSLGFIEVRYVGAFLTGTPGETELAQDEQLMEVANSLAENDLVKKNPELLRFMRDALDFKDKFEAEGNEEYGNLTKIGEGLPELLKEYRADNPDLWTDSIPIPHYRGVVYTHAAGLAGVFYSMHGAEFEVTTFLRALDECTKWREARVKAMNRPGFIIPKPTSAQNLEVGAMAFAWVAGTMPLNMPQRLLSLLINRILEARNRKNAKDEQLRQWLDDFPMEAIAVPINAPRDQKENCLTTFLGAWSESGYARVELPETLCASLCLTDTSSVDELTAPWEAWSLVVPPNLLPGANGAYVARVWCQGITPIGIISDDGGPLRVHDSESTSTDSERYSLLEALVRGVVLILNDPKRVKRTTRHASSSGKSNKRTTKLPCYEYASYHLSSPVKLTGPSDVRHVVRKICRGELKDGPKSQWLVRGHYRNQAHGRGRQLRKTIWIAPHWKGDAEARILLRSHKVEA